METLHIPPHLETRFVNFCRKSQLDANRMLEQLIAHFVSHPPKPSIEAWAENFLGGSRLSQEDKLVDGLTVNEYFTLSEKQRNELWEKWESEADRRITARGITANANTSG